MKRSYVSHEIINGEIAMHVQVSWRRWWWPFTVQTRDETWFGLKSKKIWLRDDGQVVADSQLHKQLNQLKDQFAQDLAQDFPQEENLRKELEQQLLVGYWYEDSRAIPESRPDYEFHGAILFSQDGEKALLFERAGGRATGPWRVLSVPLGERAHTKGMTYGGVWNFACFDERGDRHVFAFHRPQSVSRQEIQKSYWPAAADFLALNDMGISKMGVAVERS